VKLSQLTFSPAQHIVVFGDPKTGKTRLVGSLAAKYKLLWIDIENGLITLTQLPIEWQDNIEVVQLPDTRTYPIAASTMLQVIKGTKTSVCYSHGAVSCPLCLKDKAAVWNNIELNALHPDEWVVVLDGITQLGNSVMAHICRDQKDDYKPDWEDYRAQGSLLDRFFSQMQQAKYNFVCTALVILTEREDKSNKLTPLCGTTNYSTNVSKYFDHVVYCEMKGKKHAFGSKTTYSLSAVAGSRTGVAIEEQKDEYPNLLPFFESARSHAKAGGIQAGGASGANQAAAIVESNQLALNTLNKGGLPSLLNKPKL
jgi:hypothetical protein